MRLVSIAAALGLILFAASSSMTAENTAPKTHTVNIENMRFDPEELTVNAGDTVIWVNKDLVPHTATSAKEGLFDSELIESGKSWQYKVEGKGYVDYICTFHPGMKGVLNIK